MKTHRNVIIRPMPEGYPADCWIVTSAIYSIEVRCYRTFDAALKYANKKAKELDAKKKGSERLLGKRSKHCLLVKVQTMR